MKIKYKIDTSCVGCGACKVVCPTHCISKGSPYYIREEACIGCGHCLTRCWRKLILPKTPQMEEI
ncbi:MAG: 4Fe-4S binding protein [Cellulosilyticaceae bacterium]